MKAINAILLILASLACSIPALAEGNWWENVGIEMIPDDDPVGRTSHHRLISIYSRKSDQLTSSAQDNTLNLNSGANTQPTEFGVFVRSGSEALGNHLKVNHLLYDIAESEGRSFGIFLTRRFR